MTAREASPTSLEADRPTGETKAESVSEHDRISPLKTGHLRLPGLLGPDEDLQSTVSNLESRLRNLARNGQLGFENELQPIDQPAASCAHAF